MAKHPSPPETRFSDSLLELSRSQDINTVFNDFLDFALLFIRWWDIKPEYFTALEQKYKENRHCQLFADAFTAMADIADNNGAAFKDPFGDFFMEHLSHGHNGQFFTPEHICDMMAQMTIGDKLAEGATVADPACGSGRLLLSAAKINRKAIFYGADISLICCKMSVLNFMMNSMCGEVTCMDTISMKHYKTWLIKKVISDNGYYLPYYIETGPEHSRLACCSFNTNDRPFQNEQSSQKQKIKKTWKQNQKPTSQLWLNLE